MELFSGKLFKRHYEASKGFDAEVIQLIRMNSKKLDCFANAHNDKRKSAFTLAEVLITLGVIGVVAAMTLPTLIQNYQKKVWVNSLKENYSLLNQGFRKMIADDNVDDIRDTEIFQSIGVYGGYGGNIYACQYTVPPNSSNCNAFIQKLSKYYKIIAVNNLENYVYKSLDGNSQSTYSNYNYAIELSNGTIIFNYYFYGFNNFSTGEQCKNIHKFNGHMCEMAGSFDIDINGTKGPNVYGRDIFKFYFSEKGFLVPYGGHDAATYLAKNSLTEENINNWKAKNNNKTLCNIKSTNRDNNYFLNGAGCTGYLIEDLNWKMDY